MFNLSQFFPKGYKPTDLELFNANIWILRNNEVWLDYEAETGNKCTWFLTSGFRTREHNLKVGGAKNSFHCIAMAGDILDKQGQPQGTWLIGKGRGYLQLKQISVEDIKHTKGSNGNWVHTDIATRGGEYKIFTP